MSELKRISVEYILKPEHVERIARMATERGYTVEEQFISMMCAGAWHDIGKKIDTWEWLIENEKRNKESRSAAAQEPKTNTPKKACATTRKQSFTRPSLDEVQIYCRERNNNIDPQTFLDFYTSNGWRVGKNPMKDWKAAVRTWEKRETYTTLTCKPHTTNAVPSSQPRNAKHYNAAAPAVGERERAAVANMKKFMEGEHRDR